MSAPVTTAAASKSEKPFCPSTWLVPHLTVYNLTVAAVIGAATGGFVTLIAVLILIATNFNALGFVE